MFSDLVYQVALTLVPNIGAVQARLLLQKLEPREIFHQPARILEKIDGIGRTRAESIKSFKDFNIAENEISFIEKNKIKPLFIQDESYPQRLLNCYDPPIILYLKGEANLNPDKTIAIIGSRTHTDYGKQKTEEIIKNLAGFDVQIISGLAYGIDAIAHKAALQNKLSTLAVMAHGLDQLYPPLHASLANDMIKNRGALLTEFRQKTKPDRHNFPTRNRIVAGMADVTIVIETGIRGGSMITAELANGYNRDVFALPGRTTDAKSEGCNYLIKTNKAILLTEAQQLIENLGWESKSDLLKNKNPQRKIFVDLTEDERKITDILQEKETVHINEINLSSGLSSGAIATALLSMEMQNLVVSLPGKFYKLS